MTICCQSIPSPVGRLYVVADNNNLKAIAYESNWKRLERHFGEVKLERNEIIEQTHAQLQEYFEKKRTEFDLPIAFTGTDFQKKTWEALLAIPYGETRSYSDQANLIGRPEAVRAVGRTNGLNPISIVVPCHRVVGKSGKLTGYAGGLDKKQFLLDLESNKSKISAAKSMETDSIS
jgi:methylated-DNA-[protein]-cysteine S-methyltransferase